jgi:hypothetical protein
VLGPSALKTKAFFATIVDPDWPVAVIDVHAFDIAYGEVSGMGAKILGRKGEYERYSDAYRDASQVIGVSTSTVQAVTWVRWRNERGIFW